MAICSPAVLFYAVLFVSSSPAKPSHGPWARNRTQWKKPTADGPEKQVDSSSCYGPPVAYFSNLPEISMYTTTMDGSTSDMEMMEIPGTSNTTAGDPNDVVKGLLSWARRLVDQGKPSQALQAVVMAMKTSGGEAAVFQILQRARELYRNKLQASADADQLASLFAQCAIAEAQPFEQTPSPSPASAAEEVAHDAYGGTSILAETGRKQIVLDAFSDGSSFICLQCGGLVNIHRKDVHDAYWCQL
ncbi:hypothetical protein Dimus_028014 [Dionaea muscipula]